MEKERESVLQIFNGCLDFLIAVIFVDIPLLRLFWCFSKLGFGAGEKRNYVGIQGETFRTCQYIPFFFPQPNI